MVERPSFSDFRLRPGRHGLPPGQVAKNQRLRLLGAAAEVLVERGYARTTSAAIVRHAGVSSETFYANFDNVDECLLAAHQAASECILRLVRDGCEARGGWQDHVRRAVDAALAFLAEEPALAQIAGAPAGASIPAVIAARARLVESLADLARSAREYAGQPAPCRSRLADRLLVDGALALACGRPAGAVAEASRPGRLAEELTCLVALDSRLARK